MARSRYLAWGIFIASLSLSMAIAMYSLARSNPPEIFAPILATNSDFVSLPGIFGSVPSFFHTLSLALILVVCVSNSYMARLHCLLWITFGLILDISQHSASSAWITGWLLGAVPESIWKPFGPYRARGTFELLDMLATLGGGLVAIVFITHSTAEQKDATWS